MTGLRGLPLTRRPGRGSTARMRSRFWLFALLVAAVLAANLALVSARFAQTSEEALGSRLTVASAGLRTQIELVDLRGSPRIAAFNPELIEATKPEGSQQPARPDERALRAAAAALQPEPDLLVVATAHAAAVSRRGKAASLGEDPARLPLIRIALEGGASPQFVTFEGKLYRAAAARIPGNAAVVLTGTAIDDRFVAQLRSLVDADVSFLHQGALVTSTLAAEDRAALAAWAKAPAGTGFGALRIVLPAVGTRFSEYLPLGAPRAATRAVPGSSRSGWSRESSTRICTRSSVSRLESGSSNRNTSGSRTMARPMATRWRWPPESWRGRRCISSPICRISAARRTRRSVSALGLPVMRSPKLRFCSTDMCG